MIYAQNPVPSITKKAHNLKREGSVYDRLYYSDKNISKSISEQRLHPIMSPTCSMVPLEKRASDPSLLMPLSSWIRKNMQS